MSGDDSHVLDQFAPHVVLFTCVVYVCVMPSLHCMRRILDKRKIAEACYPQCFSIYLKVDYAK